MKFWGTIAVGGGFTFDAAAGLFVDAVAIGFGVAVAAGVGVAVDIVVAVGLVVAVLLAVGFVDAFVLGLAVVGVAVVGVCFGVPSFSFVLDDEALVPLKVSTADILFIRTTKRCSKKSSIQR